MKGQPSRFDKVSEWLGSEEKALQDLIHIRKAFESHIWKAPKFSNRYSTHYSASTGGFWRKQSEEQESFVPLG